MNFSFVHKTATTMTFTAISAKKNSFHGKQTVGEQINIYQNSQVMSGVKGRLNTNISKQTSEPKTWMRNVLDGLGLHTVHFIALAAQRITHSTKEITSRGKPSAYAQT